MLRHKTLIQCARYAFGLAGVYDEDEAERIVEPRQPRMIGSAPQPTSTVTSQEPTEEEKTLRDKIHALCGELDYNGAQERMILGQFQGKLPSLVEDEGEKRERAEKAKSQSEQADTQVQNHTQAEPSKEEPAKNGKSNKFKF